MRIIPASTDEIVVRQKNASEFSSLSSENLLSSWTLKSKSKLKSKSSVGQSVRIPSFSKFMVEDALKNAEMIIKKWDRGSLPSSYMQVDSMFIGNNNREESGLFLKSVNLLRQVMHFLVDCNDMSSGKLVLAQNLTQIAMRRLEIELHNLLAANKEMIDPESFSGKFSASRNNLEHGNSDEEGKDAVADIKAIADCMVSAGYGTECAEIYKLMRKSAVDEGLYRLGIHRYKSSHVRKMSREERDLSIGRWMDAAKVAVHSFFRRERILCDRLFASSDKIREKCFTEITKEAAVNAFRFPELIAECKGSPEGIHVLIDLYGMVYELWPEIESIFLFESTLEVKLQTLTSLVKLGKSVQAIISTFESTIQKDSSKVPVNGGGIHLLTRTVMTFVDSLTNRSGVLSDILADHPHPDNPKLPESYFEGSNRDDAPASPVSTRLTWTILVLLCKLDRKAELYKNASLSYLFLANNLHFVVRQVSATNLKYLLGDEWITQHTEKIRQYVCGYESTAWNNVLAMLPSDGKPTEIPYVTAIECLGKFNEAFEAEYRRQTSWIVPDKNLREEIHASVVKKLMPTYKEFSEMHFGSKDLSDEQKDPARFELNDLGNYLADLFRGMAVSESTSSRSPSSTWSIGCLPR